MAAAFGYSEKVSVTAAQKAEFLDFAGRTVQAAGAATLPFFRADVEIQNKRNDGGFDPVTEADKAAVQPHVATIDAWD